jgi:hypothetical protein
MSEEPINILAELVIASANDVLAGLQTWEEHLVYLRDIQIEYESRGIKLPLDLSEPERTTDENHRHKPAPGPSTDIAPRDKETFLDFG